MTTDRDGCRQRYSPIGDLAIVGDCHTAALINRGGSVDWFCPGRFDAPAAFCRLLDSGRGGYLRVAPTGAFTSSRAYRRSSNILETVFDSAGARVRVTDFMPVHRRRGDAHGEDAGSSRQLLRLVEGLAGEAEIEVAFKASFDFARQTTRLVVQPGMGVIARDHGRQLVLYCPEATFEPGHDGEIRAQMYSRPGERHWIALAETRDTLTLARQLNPAELERQLTRTHDYWQSWTDSCSYRGPYPEQVMRSALTLKLLTYEPTGAIVAAPTTSLPESIGGTRNWDYRYSWLRDSTMMLYALLTLGFHHEAHDFFAWLRRTLGADLAQAPQIMYGIEGQRDLPEIVLDQLEGYCCSRPVRVGNAAVQQHQLDVYGEVLTAAYLRYHVPETTDDIWQHPQDEHLARRPSARGWAFLTSLVEDVLKVWREPDRGIWEVRGEPRHFVYSKLMCWAAVDRGLKLSQELGLPAPIVRWQQARSDLQRAILEQGYNQDVGAFTQSFGSAALDASVLAISRLGFLPPTDPRVQSTVEQIRTRLTRGGLVYRYLDPDGLPRGEATFAMCTFWLVDALALGGRLDEAHDLFERVLARANDVGLLSEEIDPDSDEMLGNFPQGFTHLALIGAAVNLAKAAKHGPETQPETVAHRASKARRAAAEGHSARDARRTAP